MTVLNYKTVYVDLATGETVDIIATVSGTTTQCRITWEGDISYLGALENTDTFV